jgi:hypothetical protein
LFSSTCSITARRKSATFLGLRGTGGEVAWLRPRFCGLRRQRARCDYFEVSPLFEGFFFVINSLLIFKLSLTQCSASARSKMRSGTASPRTERQVGEPYRWSLRFWSRSRRRRATVGVPDRCWRQATVATVLERAAYSWFRRASQVDQKPERPKLGILFPREFQQKKKDPKKWQRNCEDKY